jgi:hypothetical protein
MLRNHGPLDFTDAEKAKWLKDRATHARCKEFACKRNEEVSKIRHRLKQKAYYLQQAGYRKPFTKDDYYSEAERIYNLKHSVRS